MNRKDRKVRKKKSRQERIRKEKHLRQSAPRIIDDDLIGPDNDFGPENVVEPFPKLPSPFAGEKALRQLQATLAEQQLGSEAEVNAFLSDYLREQQAGLPPTIPGSPADRAQDLAYQAMEEEDPVRAVRLAQEALQLDPDCVDALTVLAQTSRSTKELVAAMQKAVAAGERSLGPAFFEENRGRFWGLIETRPYMRARADLAEVLRLEERTQEAIAHYEALLDLNPNDNQGNRDVLVGCYLLVDDLAGVRRLSQQYEQDTSSIFLWARVLERFLSGDQAGAAKALKSARKQNQHVEAFLTGQKQLPLQLPDYYQLGDVTEAYHCVYYLGAAWDEHPQAVSWLKNIRS